MSNKPSTPVKYHKLVRDNIVPLLKNKKVTFTYHVASNDEYWKKLREKLQEEVKEFLDSESIEELADIEEVLHAIYKEKSITRKDVEVIRQKKRRERGSFTNKFILDEIIES